MQRRSFLASGLGIASCWGIGAVACRRATKRVIGVAPKGTSSIFWQSVQAGVNAAGHDFDVEIVWNGPPTETEYARQIQIVEAMINRGVDGIVLSPAQSTALVAVVERAAGLGIPVTIFDSGIDTDRYVSYVATNNHAAGGLGADTVAGLLGGKGRVAMVRHAPGSDSTDSRERGFQERLQHQYPDVAVVAEQYCMSDRARALTVAENMLNANPDLQAFFCSSEAATIGASQLVRARDLLGKLRLVGFDASSTLQQDLKEGVIDALVVQDPYQIGYVGVKTVIQHLNGETPPKQIEMPARVVRAGDLADPEIQKLLNPIRGA
jgi:ribose transport system substrate-binding protein